MPRISPDAAGGKNVCAFLDMIKWSEIGPEMIAASDDGYNVLVGSLPGKLKLFHGYAHHPHILNHKLDSTAAGGYQIIYPTWMNLAEKLRLSSFRPICQDMAAIGLLHERNAMDDIVNGRFESAVFKCSREWASLPGSTAGQHVNKIHDLQMAYVKAGGKLDSHG